MIRLALSLLLLAAAVPAAAQPAAPSDYVVGPRDVLTITVFGEPELSRKYTVDSDGTFDFPWIGRVRAAGLGLRAVEERLVALLADGYLRRPQVTIEVEQGGFRSRWVYVMGEVRSPGRYSLAGNMTLLEALLQAGSITASAAPTLLVVRAKDDRAELGPVLPDATEDADVTRVNIQDLQIGKAGQNVVLEDGDTIFVPKAESFFVTGHVRSPGSYVFEPGLTVLQAISLAGGITDRGSTRGIRIRRIVDGRQRDVSVNMEDRVQPGDTIIVRQRFF